MLGGKKQQQTLDLLYQRLQAPPYGMKQGAIPVLLAAVLLYHADDVRVYQDGTFIPTIGIGALSGPRGSYPRTFCGEIL